MNKEEYEFIINTENLQNLINYLANPKNILVKLTQIDEINQIAIGKFITKIKWIIPVKITIIRDIVKSYRSTIISYKILNNNLIKINYNIEIIFIHKGISTLLKFVLTSSGSFNNIIFKKSSDFINELLLDLRNLGYIKGN
jgi:hypothetical protein